MPPLPPVSAVSLELSGLQVLPADGLKLGVGRAEITATGPSFAELLGAGAKRVEAKVAEADALLLAFAQGEAVPVHRVTLALEQARISVELAVEIRSRLIETYRDFMNMQL